MSSNSNDNYYGWSNRETWLAYLWLTNDESSYSLLEEASKLDLPVWKKSEWLRDILEEQLMNEIDGPSIWRDLLMHAFRSISWEQIIRSDLDC